MDINDIKKEVYMAEFTYNEAREAYQNAEKNLNYWRQALDKSVVDGFRYAVYELLEKRDTQLRRLHHYHDERKLPYLQRGKDTSHYQYVSLSEEEAIEILSRQVEFNVDCTEFIL